MILVCTVGGSSRPVVNALRENQAKYVYFICSSGSGPHASDRTIDAPFSEGHGDPKVKREPIAREAELTPDTYEVRGLADPDDLASVVRECGEIDRDIQARFGAHIRVVGNYTGGTKTMSAGVAIFATLARGRWELQLQAAGQRTDLIRVTSADVATLQGGLAAVLAGEAEQDARRLLQRHEFEGARARAAGAIRDLQLSASERRSLGELAQECEMHIAWDALEYESALGIVSQVKALEANVKPLKVLIGSAKLLSGDDVWGPNDRRDGLELVRDLVANARRCADRKRYDDAIGRLYRATELIAQARLLRIYGIKTANVDPAHPKLPEARRSDVEGWLNPRNGQRPAGLFQAFLLLEWLGDPLGRYAQATKSELKNLIEVRNQSIFAHGLKPIRDAQWRSAGQAWLTWLDGGIAASQSPA